MNVGENRRVGEGGEKKGARNEGFKNKKAKRKAPMKMERV